MKSCPTVFVFIKCHMTWCNFFNTCYIYLLVWIILDLVKMWKHFATFLFCGYGERIWPVYTNIKWFIWGGMFLCSTHIGKRKHNSVTLCEKKYTVFISVTVEQVVEDCIWKLCKINIHIVCSVLYKYRGLGSSTLMILWMAAFKTDPYFHINLKPKKLERHLKGWSF